MPFKNLNAAFDHARNYFIMKLKFSYNKIKLEYIIDEYMGNAYIYFIV